MVWGVHAVVTAELHTMTETVTRATRIARTEGFARHGEEVVVTAGVPFNQPGTTNALRVAHGVMGFGMWRRSQGLLASDAGMRWYFRRCEAALQKNAAPVWAHWMRCKPAQPHE